MLTKNFLIKKYCPDCRGWVDVSHSKGHCPFCGNDEMEDEVRVERITKYGQTI